MKTDGIHNSKYFGILNRGQKKKQFFFLCLFKVTTNLVLYLFYLFLLICKDFDIKSTSRQRIEKKKVKIPSTFCCEQKTKKQKNRKHIAEKSYHTVHPSVCSTPMVQNWFYVSLFFFFFFLFLV